MKVTLLTSVIVVVSTHTLCELHDSMGNFQCICHVVISNIPFPIWSSGSKLRLDSVQTERENVNERSNLCT